MPQGNPPPEVEAQFRRRIDPLLAQARIAHDAARVDLDSVGALFEALDHIEQFPVETGYDWSPEVRADLQRAVREASAGVYPNEWERLQRAHPPEWFQTLDRMSSGFGVEIPFLREALPTPTPTPTPTAGQRLPQETLDELEDHFLSVQHRFRWLRNLPAGATEAARNQVEAARNQVEAEALEVLSDTLQRVQGAEARGYAIPVQLQEEVSNTLRGMPPNTRQFLVEQRSVDPSVARILDVEERITSRTPGMQAYFDQLVPELQRVMDNDPELFRQVSSYLGRHSLPSENIQRFLADYFSMTVGDDEYVRLIGGEQNAPRDWGRSGPLQRYFVIREPEGLVPVVRTNIYVHSNNPNNPVRVHDVSLTNLENMADPSLRGMGGTTAALTALSESIDREGITVHGGPANFSHEDLPTGSPSDAGKRLQDLPSYERKPAGTPTLHWFYARLGFDARTGKRDPQPHRQPTQTSLGDIDPVGWNRKDFISGAVNTKRQRIARKWAERAEATAGAAQEDRWKQMQQRELEKMDPAARARHEAAQRGISGTQQVFPDFLTEGPAQAPEGYEPPAPPEAPAQRAPEGGPIRVHTGADNFLEYDSPQQQRSFLASRLFDFRNAIADMDIVGAEIVIDDLISQRRTLRRRGPDAAPYLPDMDRAINSTLTTLLEEGHPSYRDVYRRAVDAGVDIGAEPIPGREDVFSPVEFGDENTRRGTLTFQTPGQYRAWLEDTLDDFRAGLGDYQDVPRARNYRDAVVHIQNLLDDYAQVQEHWHLGIYTVNDSSAYASLQREHINERLRVLSNVFPEQPEFPGLEPEERMENLLARNHSLDVTRHEDLRGLAEAMAARPPTLNSGSMSAEEGVRRIEAILEGGEPSPPGPQGVPGGTTDTPLFRTIEEAQNSLESGRGGMQPLQALNDLQRSQIVAAQLPAESPEARRAYTAIAEAASHATAENLNDYMEYVGADFEGSRISNPLRDRRGYQADALSDHRTFIDQIRMANAQDLMEEISMALREPPTDTRGVHNALISLWHAEEFLRNVDENAPGMDFTRHGYSQLLGNIPDELLREYAEGVKAGSIASPTPEHGEFVGRVVRGRQLTRHSDVVDRELNYLTNEREHEVARHGVDSTRARELSERIRDLTGTRTAVQQGLQQLRRAAPWLLGGAAIGLTALDVAEAKRLGELAKTDPEAAKREARSFIDPFGISGGLGLGGVGALTMREAGAGSDAPFPTRAGTADSQPKLPQRPTTPQEFEAQGITPALSQMSPAERIRYQQAKEEQREQEESQQAIPEALRSAFPSISGITSQTLTPEADIRKRAAEKALKGQ